VTATRVSPGAVSAGTPMSMGNLLGKRWNWRRAYMKTPCRSRRFCPRTNKRYRPHPHWHWCYETH